MRNLKDKEKVQASVEQVNDLNMTKKCVLLRKKRCVYLKAFPVVHGQHRNPYLTFLGVNWTVFQHWGSCCMRALHSHPQEQADQINTVLEWKLPLFLQSSPTPKRVWFLETRGRRTCVDGSADWLLFLACFFFQDSLNLWSVITALSGFNFNQTLVT